MNRTLGLYIFGLIAVAVTAVFPSQTWISLVAFLIIMPLVAIWIWRNQGRPLEELGYSLSQGWFRNLAIGLLIGLGITIIFALIRQFGGWIMLTQKGYSTSILISVLPQILLRMIVVVAIEEFVFRGFFLQALTKRTRIWAAIVLSSLLWGVSQLGSMVNAGYSIGDTSIAIVSYMAWGIALSMCYLIAKRSLWLPYGFHLGANLGFSFIGLYFNIEPNAPQWWIGHYPWSSVSGLIGSLAWVIVALVAYRLARPISKAMLEEKIDKVDASETGDLLKAPRMLSVLALMTLCAIFILFLIFSYLNIFDGYELISGLLGFLALIGLLTTAVSINARKRGSAKQKKAANRYIAIGIIGMIAGVGLLMLFLTYIFSMIA